jgi:hypothetical protein
LVSAHLERSAWPTCAICNKPVDELIHAPDLLRQEEIFVAKCHGQIERVEIPRNFLVDKALHMSFGRCFEPKAKALAESTVEDAG